MCAMLQYAPKDKAVQSYCWFNRDQKINYIGVVSFYFVAWYLIMSLLYNLWWCFDRMPCLVCGAQRVSHRTSHPRNPVQRRSQIIHATQSSWSISSSHLPTASAPGFCCWVRSTGPSWCHNRGSGRTARSTLDSSSQADLRVDPFWALGTGWGDRNSHHSQSSRVQMNMGPFQAASFHRSGTTGYNVHCEWWEITVLLRKTFLIGALVLLPVSYAPLLGGGLGVFNRGWCNPQKWEFTWIYEQPTFGFSTIIEGKKHENTTVTWWFTQSSCEGVTS